MYCVLLCIRFVLTATWNFGKNKRHTFFINMYVCRSAALIIYSLCDLLAYVDPLLPPACINTNDPTMATSVRSSQVTGFGYRKPPS